jgi:hypothetical protein
MGFEGYSWLRPRGWNRHISDYLQIVIKMKSPGIIIAYENAIEREKTHSFIAGRS